MSVHHGPANRGRRVLRTAAPLFVREPYGPPAGGAIVLHDVFGVTGYAEAVCRLLARQGRLAVSPYLYYESGGPAFEADELTVARAHMDSLTAQDVAADVSAALNYLAGRTVGPVLVIGFSMGGYLATWTAAHHAVQAAIAVSPSGPWAGMPPPEVLVADRRSPWLGVVGESDLLVDADLLGMATSTPGPPAALERISGAGHGFYRAGRPRYDAEAEEESWRRICRFLQKNTLP
ncbi:dienelactone hydrolase family protein [Nonomuraea sp. NPDC059194]|uniref:dienelactone hydrolase family protein n=1 Tax=Nonomuraea sp. NPDC059194 TaxID=3346764 RepID=UPI0036799D10